MLHSQYLVGLFLLGIIYVVTNYNLFINYFASPDIEFVSHRVEFCSHTSNRMLFNGLFDLFWETQYHSGILPTKIIVITVIFTCIIQLGIDKKLLKYFATVIVLLFLSFFADYLKNNTSFEILNSFQFNRFYFLLPTLWMVVFGFSLKIISRKLNFFVAVVFTSLLFYQIYDSNQEIKCAYCQLRGKTVNRPSFRQFYDEDLFDKIADDIAANRTECCVASVGMFPAIAEYNGFHTVDGYVANYSLDYKHRFREVIEDELLRSDGWRKYFDNWGSRCYIFSSALESNFCSKEDDIRIDLHINTEKLKDLGCQYLFSAVSIENYNDLGLDFVGSYSGRESYWCVRVYRIV